MIPDSSSNKYFQSIITNQYFKTQNNNFSNKNPKKYFRKRYSFNNNPSIIIHNIKLIPVLPVRPQDRDHPGQAVFPPVEPMDQGSTTRNMVPIPISGSVCPGASFTYRVPIISGSVSPVKLTVICPRPASVTGASGPTQVIS